ncbi:MAG: C1 family peptidase [Saprospiraceae bacterium]
MRNIFLIFLALLLQITTAYSQRYSTGLLLDDDAYEAVPLKKPVLQRNYENLPASISLKAFCPQPQDQGAYANCVGWAAGYAGRTILEALQLKNSDNVTITEQAFSPDFLYLLNKSAADANCQRGISIQQVLKTMQEKGVPRRREFAAGCHPSVPMSILTKAQPNRIEGYTRLFDKETPDDFRIKIIKKSLAQQKPVVVGIECYESFKNAKEYWEGAKDKFVGGHALCIVGYDEQRGAFEVMNSWGIDWGNQGFSWIRYHDFSNIVKYAFELITGNPNNVSTSTSAVVEKTLSGSLEMVLASGEKIDITTATKPERGITAVKTGATAGVNFYTTQGYPSGTRYRLYFTNEEPAYVYVLGSDLTGVVGQVFPPDSHTSPHLSYAGNAIALPDETWYIEMDNTVGTDFIGVLYSFQALDMEAMVEQMNKMAGNFSEKLQTAIGPRLIPANSIAYHTDRIGFHAKSKDRTVLATIIAMEHTAR